jgi:hypothetical protein
MKSEEVRQALGRTIRDGRPSHRYHRPDSRAGQERAAAERFSWTSTRTMLEVIALTRSELRSNGISLQTAARPDGCRICPAQNFRCYSNCQGGFNSLIRRKIRLLRGVTKFAI